MDFAQQVTIKDLASLAGIVLVTASGMTGEHNSRTGFEKKGCNVSKKLPNIPNVGEVIEFGRKKIPRGSQGKPTG